MEELLTKEQFLAEHNRLSPNNLQATFALLTKFQEEKRPLLKDSEWSHRLRIPLISWIAALPQEKKKMLRKSNKVIYRNYPETH